MTSNIKKNLFRLEKEEFDIIEPERESIIETQKKEKKIKLYPVKENKKLNSKIKTSRKPLDTKQDNVFQIAPSKENITISAEDYPGEVVQHNQHYYISLKDQDSFSWFLLK